MKSNTGELGFVEPYKRWVIYRDGREPDYLDIAPPHQAHMEGLARDEGGIFQ